MMSAYRLIVARADPRKGFFGKRDRNRRVHRGERSEHAAADRFRDGKRVTPRSECFAGLPLR